MMMRPCESEFEVEMLAGAARIQTGAWTLTQRVLVRILKTYLLDEENSSSRYN